MRKHQLKFISTNPSDINDYVVIGFEGVINYYNAFIMVDPRIIRFHIKTYDYYYGGNTSNPKNYRILVGQPELTLNGNIHGTLVTDFNKELGTKEKGDQLIGDHSACDLKDYLCNVTFDSTIPDSITISLKFIYQKWEYLFPKYQWVNKSESSIECNLHIVPYQFEYLPVGQNNARQADDTDLLRDTLGYINPNLHRRINSISTKDSNPNVLDKRYKLGIYSNDSYRTVESIIHDEDDFELSEIP